jgi:uncharacterized protein YktB (UPF0637 family)
MSKSIDVEFYRTAKADLVDTIKRRGVKKWEEFNNEIGMYCACFGLPVFVAIIFCEEEFPEYAKELANKKKVVQEFYDYEV